MSDFFTRAPLSCTPSVRRGQQVACRISEGNWSVTGWELTPDSASVPAVQENSPSKEWSGIAPMGGTVTAQVTDGTTARSFKARFTVTNRPSAWNSDSVQTYRVGPEITAPDVEPDTGVFLGMNCPEIAGKADCVVGGRVQPQPRGAGFNSDEIPTGPNKGYWSSPLRATTSGV